VAEPFIARVSRLKPRKAREVRVMESIVVSVISLSDRSLDSEKSALVTRR
jgi:hypothetical protein